MVAVQLRTEPSERLELPHPYLLFLGDVQEPSYAKTAFGLRDWAQDKCIGELALPSGTVSAGLPRLTPAEARARGARALVIGVANPGGVIGRGWVQVLLEALEAGLDLIGGLHARLRDVPELASAAQRLGRRLIDVRDPPPNIPLASGEKRSGNRLLTVGTDCALGKKYTALALARAFRARGLDADFRATGQTGILIAGGGMPMDAVVADFEAGAAEMLSPAAAPGHWDVIEGQGSVLHPAYAAVSLGLLHGSQPDVFVVCHQPGRQRLMGHEAFALPSVDEVIDLTVRLGRRTNPAIRCAGVSLNTSAFALAEAEALLTAESERLGLPAADPIRGGDRFEALVGACLA
jgi:uncharacterized NAD-dependent epimerase/dehydratase family protein